MVFFDRNYVQMAMDFDKKAVISALMFHFFKKKKSEEESCVFTFNEPKTP
jgi:hypothetical protein